MKTVLPLFLLSLSLALAANAAILNLKFFTQGYYIGSGQMTPLEFNCGICNCPTQVDTFVVQLHDSINPATVVASSNGILMVDGTMTCGFANSVVGNRYYIAVKYRNTVETWSADPVSMSASTSYDFSTSPTPAYGNNMILVDTTGGNKFAFYTGDITQDGNIDQIDYLTVDYGINHGLFGCSAADLNGDGNVDLLDFAILAPNICAGIYTHHP
jgi:hypothetical protein